MKRAEIRNSNMDLIGTIEDESGGYRVWWRSRNNATPGNSHKASQTLHPTIASARQEVFAEGAKLGEDFQVVEPRES